MNKKKLLLSIPFFYGYETKMKEVIEEFTDIEVTLLVHKDYSAQYKNIFQRLHSLYYKTVGKKKRNIKYEIYTQNLLHKLSTFPENSFDFHLGIRPDMMATSVNKEIAKKAKKNIAYYWDSVERVPEFLEYASFFDKVFSYDPYDCEQYGYQFITNFYLPIQPASSKPKYDLYCFFELDQYRMKILDKIVHYINANTQLTYFIEIYVRRSKMLRYLKKYHGYAAGYRRIMSVKEVYDKYGHCKAILEVVHAQNKGLSLRTFEAMHLRKKLITTNPEIKKYPFYNENNILVLEDQEDSISEDFVLSAYEDLPETLVSKYSLVHWINEVLYS